MLTSLVSDFYRVDTFVVVYKCIRLFTFSSQGHCNFAVLKYNDHRVDNQYFLVNISIQYFSLSFSIKNTE